jgi:hypothetical protein
MHLSRDAAGWLIPQEPFYVWLSDRESPTAKRLGAGYAPAPDLWKCRDHPDWQGEDFPEDWISKTESRGGFSDYPGGPRAFWKDESIQAHAEIHEATVEGGYPRPAS